VTDLATLRIFADMRQARLRLRGLDSPDVATRVRMIRDPEVFKALILLFYATEKLVSAPDEGVAFWHPPRATLTAAERKVERLRAEIGK
jgi:hypothetical protein